MNNKVLLVDDEPKVLAALRRSMGRRFSISCAESGAKALEMVDTEGPFAAIVSDVNMPGMTGIDLMREMRRRAPETVRLILTGRSDFDVAVDAVNHGAVFRFHTKPIDAEVLEMSIENALLRHQLDKHAGTLFDPDDSLRREVADLRDALRAGELRMFVQPQLRLSDGAVTGAEALLRWDRAGQGLFEPRHFLGLAEASGLMGDITSWVLDKACAEARVWHDRGLPTMRIAVNMTAANLRDPGFPELVAGRLDHHGVSADWLELELTEGAILTEIDRIKTTLHALSSMGVELSIDDFGTGYSSFGWLRQLPVDRLKIDQMFVADIVTEPKAFRVVETIIALAGDLGLSVVAEGVETAAQQAMLAGAGCASVQGYFIARPMSPADFTTWLAGRVAT